MTQLVMSRDDSAHPTGVKLRPTCSTEDLKNIEDVDIGEGTWNWLSFSLIYLVTKIAYFLVFCLNFDFLDSFLFFFFY